MSGSLLLIVIAIVNVISKSVLYVPIPEISIIKRHFMTINCGLDSNYCTRIPAALCKIRL